MFQMLRVWFSCSQFVPSVHGLTMTDTLEVRNKGSNMQLHVFWCLKKRKRQRSIKYWPPSTDGTVCHKEVCTNGLKCLKASEPVLLMQKDKAAKPDEHNMVRGHFILRQFLQITECFTKH
jgi:hypothetical protein